MCDGAERAIGIRREVNPRSARLDVQHGTNETRILVREPIVFLSCPGRSFNVIQRPTGLSPCRFAAYFDEFGVLDHHGVDDTKEGLVGREEAGAACECVALEHALTGMFRKDFDDTPALGAGHVIPLEVAPSVFKNSIEFVGD